MIDFEGIQRLAPEGRVESLKELLNTLNSEIKERQKDIEQALHMLEVAEREVQVLEEIQLPEKTEELTEKIEKIEEKKSTEPEQLEDILRNAPRTSEAIERIAHAPVSEVYSEIRNIYDRQAETGIESAGDRDKLYALQKGLEEKKKDMQDGHYTPGQNEGQLLNAAESIVDSMYKKPGDEYKNM